MDIADRTQADMEYLSSINKPNTEKEVEETGYCLYCGVPLPQGRRWCNAECRDAWEKEQKRY